jgi:hypothetical protein
MSGVALVAVIAIVFCSLHACVLAACMSGNADGSN